MTKPWADEFLRETRIAKLATLNEDGSPNVVPVWFEWDGEEARVFTSRTSSKIARIERDPRVALSVEEPVGVDERWVTVEGTAEIREGGLEVARRLIDRYYTPEHAAEVWPGWEKMGSQWVTIAIRPGRIRAG